MRAIFINAKDKVVQELQTDGSLEALQKFVDGYIEQVPYAKLLGRDALFVNEEGLLRNDLTYGFYFDGQPLRGNGVVIGHTEDGDTRSAATSAKEVEELVTWPDGSGA
jgi:hypothetical protein